MTIHIPKTKKEYYMITNRMEIYEKAQELGADNVILLTETQLDEEDVSFLLKSPKAVAFVFFCGCKDEILSGLIDQLDQKDNKMSFTLKNGSIYAQRVSYASIIDVQTSLGGIIKSIEYDMKYHGFISLSDYENRCGNCHSELLPGEKYCKWCGTKRGEGEYKPYHNEMYAVYGAPTYTYFKCKKCGRKFGDYSIGKSKVIFCPECGAKVTARFRGW